MCGFILNFFIVLYFELGDFITRNVAKNEANISKFLLGPMAKL